MNIMNIYYYPVLFIATLPQHIHTMVTLVSHYFPASFTWSSSLVETAYRILNMIHVIYLSMLSVNDRFWTLAIQSGRNKRKNRDVSRDDNGRRIQNPEKHLRWSFLQKQLPVFNSWLFLQNTSYYLFHRVMNMPR